MGATDRLIDLVVYRLDGLTEGDVEVVEGAGGAEKRDSLRLRSGQAGQAWRGSP
jgi:hypothetical protein